MNSWYEVEDIEKIINLFGETVGFHDAEIISVKYNGDEAKIKIDCRGFIKTMSLFKEKYKKYDNVYITIRFENVNFFEIDYDYGINFINELIIEKENDLFIIALEEYYLKLICKNVIIEDISIIYKQNNEHNKMLDKLLKSDI